MLSADDAAYEETRKVWNAMIDRRPGLIARCTGTVDVVQAVRFARQHGLLCSVRGGGHNIAGLAVCEGGLMIDMSLLRGVWVDPQQRTALAQAGCLLADVDRETQLHGLAAVLGFVSATGIAGLTVGGGFGYLTRRYGWTCDNLISMEVVTAEGQVLRASADENAELFWALRGGTGNFGIVTSFEYQLHPVGPEILGGAIAWVGDDAAQVLEAYRAFSAVGAARADFCGRAAHRAPRALAAQGGARQAHRRGLRLPLGQGGGRRSPARPAARERANRSPTSSPAARTCRCKACSTPRSPRAGAITGSRITCPPSAAS